MEFFPFSVTTMGEGLKYLGFKLSPNCYKKEDWNWLLEKLDHRVNIWWNRWISREVMLILVTSIFESILVY